MQLSGFISYVWLALFLVTVVLLYRSFKSDGETLAERESKYCIGFFIVSIIVSSLLFSFDSTRNHLLDAYIGIVLLASGVFGGGLGLGLVLVFIIKTSPSEDDIKRVQELRTKSEDVKLRNQYERIPSYEDYVRRIEGLERTTKEIEMTPDDMRIQELIKIRKMIRKAIYPRPFNPQQKIIKEILDVLDGGSKPPSPEQLKIEYLESALAKVESELGRWIKEERDPIIRTYLEKAILSEDYIRSLLRLQEKSDMNIWPEGFLRLDLETTVATIVQAVDDLIKEDTPESRFFLGYLLNNPNFRSLLINLYNVPWESDCWTCGKEEDYYCCIVHHKIIDALTQHDDSDSIAALYTYITSVQLRGEENYVGINDNDVNFVFTSSTAFRNAIAVVAKDPEYNPKVLKFLLDLDEKWNWKDPLSFRLYLIKIIGDIWKEKAIPLVKKSLWHEYIESQALEMGIKIAAKHDDEQKSIGILKELLSDLMEEIHWDPNSDKYRGKIVDFVSVLKEARPDASDMLKKTLDTYPELFDDWVFSAFEPILTMIAPRESKEWWRYFFIQISRENYGVFWELDLNDMPTIEPSILSDILYENEEEMKRGINLYLSSFNLEFNRFGNVLIDSTKRGILENSEFKLIVLSEIYRIASNKEPYFRYMDGDLIDNIKEEKLMHLEEYQWKDLVEMMNLVVRLLLLEDSEKTEIDTVLDLFLEYYTEVQQYYSFNENMIQENSERIKDVYENDRLNLINEVFHSLWDE